MKLFYTLLIILFNVSISYAWIYPEHRDIALLAIQNLSPEYRLVLDKLWAEARVGYEERLTEAVIDATQSVHPTQLDYAAWPAISGDHSCSPEIMLYNVLQTDWILNVAHVTAQLKIDLAESENEHDRVNALRDSDVHLQQVDPKYATRAGTNNVHFLLSRPNVDVEVREYLIACLSDSAALNALGTYAWFHVSALQKASKYFNENLSSEERSAISLAILADEAFAIHFLEDAFAAGHTAGTWGDASQRKGTHDFYNEHGIEVTTWDGQRMILMGDAFMRQQDAILAAKAVQLSIEQLLDAATGKFSFDYLFGDYLPEDVPDTFNVCKNNYILNREIDKKLYKPLAKILVPTPVPGLAEGEGDIPRYRAELGLFIGVASALRINGVSNGFSVNQNTSGAIGGLGIAVRLGMGLEGVMHGGGDGLVFLDVGWREDGSSTMKFGDAPILTEGGQFTAAIPARAALTFRLRMPFYIIPFDLLITAPVLLFASPETFASMAVTAGLGGLIPWQAGIETGIGRFQFILGREIGVSLYSPNTDALLIPLENGTTALLNYKSTQLDFPIVEYRPFRTFSSDQSSSLKFQLAFGVDIPHSETVVAPEGIEVPELRSIWYFGLRVAFDWRSYF